MKKLYSIVLFVFCLFAFLSYSSPSAYAFESLEDFENKVRLTWHNSGDRVTQLLAEKAKIVGQEDNFATLYGVKKSDIYVLVAQIDSVVRKYINIKEEIKNNAIHVASTTSIDSVMQDASKENKLQLFFDFLSANAGFSELLRNAINEKSSVQKIIETYEKQLSVLENAYNVTGEEANYDSSQYTKNAFNFYLAKLELETFLIDAYYGELHLKTLERTITGYEKAIEKTKSTAGKILAGIDTDTIDMSFLNQRIDKILSYYDGIYNSLREDTILGFTQDELALLPKEFSQLLQNTAQTEQKYVLSMYEEWLSTLPIWYTLLDIVSGDKPISTTEDIQEYIDFFNKHADYILLNRLVDFYAVIAKAGGPTENRLHNDPHYGQLVLKFEKIIAELKQRYLTYVKLHNNLQDEYSMIEFMVQMLHHRAGDKTVKKSLRQKHFHDFLYFELFNIAHRPITVGKIGRSLLIILYAYIIVFLCKKVIYRRNFRFGKHHQEDESYITSKRLILEKTIAIIVYVLAFLCIMTELNVPLTAFAYMGGVGAVAIGFGAQTIFANLFSGLILIYGNKIRVKDWVIVDNTLGRVEDITAQNTIIAYDCFNQHMVVPNSLMLKDTVRNVTRADGLVGDGFEVYIDDVHDLSRAIAAIYRKKDSIKELLPSYFFAAWSGEMTAGMTLRPSIIISYTYDVRLMTAGAFKAIMRKAVYDALIEEGIYEQKKWRIN